jgi:RNA polymerase sigma factor (sigma-70 family)
MGDSEELEHLIRGCARNDRASQEELYKQLYVPLFCHCRRYFQHDHEAIESVNDGMLKVFEKIGAYRPEKGKFFNWVYTIVRNTALDKFRSSVSIPRPADPGEIAEAVVVEEPGSNPGIWLEDKDVYVLLDRLGPASRVIFGLFYIEGYSIREIADELAISGGTVKWHLSDSRKKLRSVLEKYFND